MLSGTIEGDIDFAALFDEELSPKARSASLAGFAREHLADAEKINTATLGFKPAHVTIVDGREGGSEDAVKPNGSIVYEFNLMTDVFSWVAEQLHAFAPVLSGRFKTSFEFFVDGALSSLEADLSAGREFVFMSSVPYAGKIEGENRAPESSQAPHGVFEAIAILAQRRFPQVDIAFTYLRPFLASSVSDTPAIIIKAGA